jgi:ribonuclease R
MGRKSQKYKQPHQKRGPENPSKRSTKEPERTARPARVDKREGPPDGEVERRSRLRPAHLPPLSSLPKSMDETPKRSHQRERESIRPSHKHQERHDPSVVELEERATSHIYATVDKNAKGFSFLIPDSKDYEHIFVPREESEALFHGDRIKVHFKEDGTIHNLEIVAHRFREMVGRYEGDPKRRGSGWLIFQRKRAREEVYIPVVKESIPKNSWVRIKLNYSEKAGKSQGPVQSQTVTGEILEVIGETLPASMDIKMIAGENNLIEEHTQAAIDEARGLTLEIPGKDLEGRLDLREIPFITIDGETARDFDDAIYVEKNPKEEGYILWVAIADVSHYVRVGSAINEEAFARGTSVYFPERAFHMLPRALSENLCSLVPNQPRLTMVSKIFLSPQGEIKATEISNAVIQSKRRATYTEIQAEYEANKENKNWEYAVSFDLYKILRQKRIDRGSIDFDLPEAVVLVDDQGEPTAIEVRDRVESHRLIEEFMIAANEAVSEWVMKQKLPFLYRIHEDPEQSSIEKFLVTAKGLGLVTDRINLKEITPKLISDLVRNFQGHESHYLLNQQLLRSLKQAIYSERHETHFGLASEAYTHFTSPIRRYPDLVVHRLLKVYIEKKRTPFEKELQQIAEHCSYRERLAAEAERECHKLKQIRMMLKNLGKEFEGMIVGMTERGFFVQIRDPYAEGFVSFDSISDDHYEFNASKMMAFGRRKRRIFKVGQKTTITVLRADLELRMVDFGVT